MENEQEERRRTPRHSAQIHAVIAVERKLLGPCVILDINPFGARLDVGSQEPPDDLYLLDTAALVGYRARVQWRRAPMVGTRFVQSWDIAAPTTPLWIQAMRAEATILTGAERGIRLVT